MNCQLLNTILTNKTLLFIPFFIMCDFVMFYCHRAVSLLNVILQTCATVMRNKRLLTYLQLQ